jgi:uncharacterized protein (DUF1697 family)
VALSPQLALLRAVNVGGKGLVSMDELKAMLADLGFQRPRSLLQSGNLVFDAEAEPETLESMLEAEMARRLGVATDVLVLGPAEWDALVAANPFTDEAESDPGHLLAMALKTAPPAGAIDALRAAIAGPERVALTGRALYAYYPDGVGRSKLTNAVIERRLGVRGTARNWNTVLKLAAMLAA